MLLSIKTMLLIGGQAVKQGIQDTDSVTYHYIDCIAALTGTKALKADKLEPMSLIKNLINNHTKE